MADAEEKPDGTDAKSADTQELERKIKELQDQLTAKDDDLRKAIAKRQEAKEQARTEAEKRAEYEQAKKLYEEEIATLKAGQATATELEAIKAERDALVAERRTELLAKLPEGKRDEFKDEPLSVLSKIVNLLPVTTPNVDGSPGVKKPTGEKKWADMTGDERLEFMRSHDSATISKKIQER